MQIYDRRHRAQRRDSIHRQTVSVTVPAPLAMLRTPLSPDLSAAGAGSFEAHGNSPTIERKKGAGLNNNAYWRMVQPRQKRDCTFTPTRDGTR